MKSEKLLTFPYIKNITAKAICKAYDFIVGEGLMMAMDDVAMNSFFKTMSLEWIEKYENYLGITHIDQGDLSYEDWLDIRRRNIATSQGNFVYKTEPWLRQQLDAILGDVPYTLYVDHDQYLIIFYVDQDASNDLLGQANIIIEDVRPLNMRKFVGKALEFDLPVSQYAYGASQDPAENEIIHIKMPEEESLTTHLANLIAQFVSENTETLVVYDDVNGTQQSFTINNKVVNGSTFQFIAVLSYDNIKTLTRFETFGSDGQMLSQFPKEGSGDLLSVAIPTAGMALNIIWKIIERNLPTTGSYLISWTDNDGSQIVDGDLPTFGVPTQRIYLPLLTRPNQKVTSYLVNGVEYQPETYFEMPNAPVAVTATFETTAYTLTLHSLFTMYAGPGGAVVPKVQTFNYGDVVNVSSWTIGDSDYKDNALVGLYLDADATQPASTITITSDVELFALYKARYEQFYTTVYQNNAVIATGVPMLTETYNALFAPFLVKPYIATDALIPAIASQPTGWGRNVATNISADIYDLRTTAGTLTIPSSGVINEPVVMFSDIIRVRVGSLVAGVQMTLQTVGLTQYSCQTAGNGAFVTLEYRQQALYAQINWSSPNIASFELWINDRKLV